MSDPKNVIYLITHNFSITEILCLDECLLVKNFEKDVAEHITAVLNDQYSSIGHFIETEETLDELVEDYYEYECTKEIDVLTLNPDVLFHSLIESEPQPNDSESPVLFRRLATIFQTKGKCQFISK